MANGNAAGALPDITLDELDRLIRIMGMLGSSHDGEALNAARLAQRWVADHGSSWQALLTPEPEPGVTGVAVGSSKGVDPALLDQLEAAHVADRAAAYKNGYEAGMRDMGTQLKAQAAALQGHPAAQAPGAALGGFNRNAQQAAQQVQPPPQAPSQAPPAVGGRVYAAGTWQWIAQELISRHAAVPGVLRNREEVFVGDILKRGFPNLTQAQEDWLRAIAIRNGLTW